MAPLHWACDRGLEEMVQILLRHDADINLKVEPHTVFIRIEAPSRIETHPVFWNEIT